MCENSQTNVIITNITCNQSASELDQKLFHGMTKQFCYD